MAAVSMSVIVVAYDSAADLGRSLPPLCEQLAAGDEVIVVDNDPQHPVAGAVREIAPQARLVEPGRNLGFAAGANAGAEHASGDLVVLLNPDVVVQPGWATAMRAAALDGWAGWMALVTLPGGREINTSGGVLHFTGVGWAGQAHEPIGAGPGVAAEVGFLSGACLALPRERWRAVGGLPAEYFMYCEDVDLSLRLRLDGGRIGVIPEARVEHDYDFAKGAWKWRMLERNRWATLLRTYPTALLLLLAPALVAAELGIWLTAIRNGWAPMKFRACLDVARALPRLRRERREIQRARQISAAAFAAPMTARLDSPYLGGPPGIEPVLRAYWTVVRAGLARVAR